MAGKVYIFIDESGDFNFSHRGTKYFTLSSITIERPFEFVSDLDTLKHNLFEEGHDIEYFHASEDAQPIVARRGIRQRSLHTQSGQQRLPIHRPTHWSRLADANPQRLYHRLLLQRVPQPMAGSH